MAATIDELFDLMQDNADYSASDSLSKARAYETALIQYMSITPSAQSDQGSSLSYDLATCQFLLSRVTSYIREKQSALAQSSASSSVRFLSAREGWR